VKPRRKPGLPASRAVTARTMRNLGKGRRVSLAFNIKHIRVGPAGFVPPWPRQLQRYA
jgi:hypothetical protein